ncbi:MAG: threonine synthase [Alphaproteobacteria bacterium]
MNYISTRGKAPHLAFDDVLLAGLARDGGLYVPDEWPQFAAADIAALEGLPYAELATRVMTPFLGGTIAEDDFAPMVEAAYAGFDDPEVAPLKPLGDNEWLLELFHGPTLAFKDMALQLVGRLFDHVLGKRGGRVTIIGATSGDTGSAAIEALRDRNNVEVFMLHPQGRVSEVQRRQMTTVLAENIHNIAIEGDFDDCQALVKAAFGDMAFRDEMRLSAVNSINWARVMAQTAYYFSSAVALGAPDRAVAFAVPSGNFGHVFAGYAAKAMGLPINRLIIGTNSNDILARFFASGCYQRATVTPTLSPSMDIQVASNFERLLFDLCGRDGAAVETLVSHLASSGGFSVGAEAMVTTKGLFAALRLDDDETEAVIAQVHRDIGMVLDPHTAIGVAAGRALRPDAETPVVAMGTAHPAKFPEAVARATGVTPALPSRLADLGERPERCEVLPNDLAAVQSLVRTKSRAA